MHIYRTIAQCKHCGWETPSTLSKLPAMQMMAVHHRNEHLSVGSLSVYHCDNDKKYHYAKVSYVGFESFKHTKSEEYHPIEEILEVL